MCKRVGAKMFFAKSVFFVSVCAFWENGGHAGMSPTNVNTALWAARANLLRQAYSPTKLRPKKTRPPQTLFFKSVVFPGMRRLLVYISIIS